MLNRITLFITLICLTVIFISCGSKTNTCKIQGTVTNLDYDTLILKKSYTDTRFADTYIPVVEGKFTFELDYEHVEAQSLVFKEQVESGSWRQYIFFPHRGNVKISISEEFKNTEITGGKLNSSYSVFIKNYTEQFTDAKPWNDSINKMWETGEYFTDTVNVLREHLNTATSREEQMKYFRLIEGLKELGLYASEPAQVFQNIVDSINIGVEEWKYQFIEQEQSILSYYLLLSDAKALTYNDKINVVRINEVFRNLSVKFPDHPYTKLLNEMLTAQTTIIVGGRYIDFEAPDLEGEVIKASEVIAGKVALIDLWATWCGPCIATSRSMIPIYEEYKDRGFTVIGVAAEIKNTDRLEKFLAKEKFPWTNLVDLDHQNGIWNKYGINGAGGTTVLVDITGEILAVHPTAEEVREILIELL